jgi:hypothetical protein
MNPPLVPRTGRLRARLADEAGARSAFWVAFGCLVAVRAFLAGSLPLTGDEAYYVRWGLHPAWGYYDHPPLIGWVLAPFASLGLHPLWVRLPQVLAVPAVALVLVAAVRDLGGSGRRTEAWLAGLLFLASGPSVLNVFVVTDTPLAVAAALAGWAWLRATRDGRTRDYALAGLALGIAFSAKYFALLLGLAFTAHALFGRGPVLRRGWLVMFACALPFGLQHLAWNLSNCWWTVSFNLLNRPQHSAGMLASLGLFALSLLYLLPPPLLLAWRRRVAALRPAREDGLFWILAVSGAVFLAVAAARPVGFHWLLSIWPFCFLLLALRVDARGLAGPSVFMIGFAALHAIVALSVVLLPGQVFETQLKRMRDGHFYNGFVLVRHGDEVWSAIAPHAAGATLGALSGSTAATLWHLSGARDTVMLAEGSGYSRQFDRDTDFRALDGRDILVLGKRPFDAGDLERYFVAVDYREVEVRGARFFLARGQGFRYAAYRDAVLVRVRDRFYARPAWLPAGGCFFCDRYFPGEVCPVTPAARAAGPGGLP